MPTIVTHAAVPLCLGLGLGSRIIPPRLLLAGVAIAMLPDADVLAFKLGVAYGHVFGHRGFTHSRLSKGHPSFAMVAWGGLRLLMDVLCFHSYRCSIFLAFSGA